MIEYLRGKLVEAVPGKVILEVGGVGLQIETPAAPGEMGPLIGREISLYTRLVLKEDEACLYGFRSVEERNLFNLVTNLSGFGPRLALGLLGVFSAPQFYVAVLEENIPLLCQAPGVGRKVAQRLVLELKEKLPRVIEPATLSLDGAAGGAVSSRGEVIEALCALGYSRAEAAAAVNRVTGQPDALTKEEILTLALKSMAG
jgi:Holliday junction DNA helicase RuvA